MAVSEEFHYVQSLKKKISLLFQKSSPKYKDVPHMLADMKVIWV